MNADLLTLSGAMLATLAIYLWLRAIALGRRSGLPRARVLYDDSSQGRPLERALVSHRHRLIGRPDFLLERGGALLPVEAKPMRRAQEPYRGDLLQLAAYCLLVEEDLGRPVSSGILRYAECSWEVDWDEGLRKELMDLLEAMDRAEASGDAGRSHDHPARCAGCSMRAHCDQRLDR